MTLSEMMYIINVNGVNSSQLTEVFGMLSQAGYLATSRYYNSRESVASYTYAIKYFGYTYFATIPSNEPGSAHAILIVGYHSEDNAILAYIDPEVGKIDKNGVHYDRLNVLFRLY